MTDIKTGINPLFLREEELRQGIELLFYAYRDFTAEPDAILAEYGFGRAHHRVIYFVGRNPGMTVSELLDILRITKQSLSRVLGQLVEEGFITQRPGLRDRRQRLLELTEKGIEL
ncbi:MAG: MarR family transcriptional regulator, partial [Magnetospirillum sp.]|nr:MarR family transcriptional regulator [Magnetospirillum sp.]